MSAGSRHAAGRLVPVLVAAVLLTGCRPFGAGVPICGDLEVAAAGETVRASVTSPSGEVHRLRSSHVIQMQAAPRAEWGPCIVQLPRGWDMFMPEPASGAVPLQFLSSGLGGAFLRVSLVDRCEPSSAARHAETPHDATARWVEVRARSRGMEVAVVPVASRHERAAYQLATDLRDRELRGSRLRVRLASIAHGSAEERIAAELADGSAVIVVDDDLSLRDELELRLPDVQRPITAEYGSILTELAERTELPRYDATWWDVTDGGCIVYEFDAAGVDAASVEEDVDAAIGRFPLGQLRRELAEHGRIVDPGPET